uniref:Uncharacterized protein n=1 Tax=Arundo donax TaxID=35708 RepID=A0A0A9B758_ARUDO
MWGNCSNTTDNLVHNRKKENQI